MKFQLVTLLLACAGVAKAQPGCTTAPAPAPAPAPAARKSYVKVVLTDVQVQDATLKAAIEKSFNDAANLWSSVILTDLPNIKLQAAVDLQNRCGNGARFAAGEEVDNVVIFASVVPIDGAGKVLGSAGPCIFSNVNGVSFPRIGRMQFDVADVANLVARNTFTDTAAHEMGHILGIGTGGWQSRVRDQQTDNPTYGGAAGAQAVRGFQAVGGAGVNVPVENVGGGGTRLSHWRTSTFDNELMTGFLTGRTNPLSAMTVGSMIDIGYQVNTNAAQVYKIPQQQNGRLLEDDEHDHEHERRLAEGSNWEVVDPLPDKPFLLTETGAVQGEWETVEKQIAADESQRNSGASTGTVAIVAGVGGMLVAGVVGAVIARKRNDSQLPMHVAPHNQKHMPNL